MVVVGGGGGGGREINYIALCHKTLHVALFGQL